MVEEARGASPGRDVMLPNAILPHSTFPTRSRLGVVRDLAVIGVCLALILGFVRQVWRAPPPERAQPAAIHVA